MTLTRTIRRREKRKRAKLRAEELKRAPRGHGFVCAPWLIQAQLDDLARAMKMVKRFREYH